MDKQTIESTLYQAGSVSGAARALNTSKGNLIYWIKKLGITSTDILITSPNSYYHAAIRTCPRCNKDKPRSEFHERRGSEGSSTYCKRCTSQESLERQRRFKRECVNYKGGKCERCGYDKCTAALDFHHLHPKDKSFALSNVKSRKMSDLIKLEIDKCMLMCANCHRETHDIEARITPESNGD